MAKIAQYREAAQSIWLLSTGTWDTVPLDSTLGYGYAYPSALGQAWAPYEGRHHKGASRLERNKASCTAYMVQLASLFVTRLVTAQQRAVVLYW